MPDRKDIEAAVYAANVRTISDLLWGLLWGSGIVVVISAIPGWGWMLAVLLAVLLVLGALALWIAYLILAPIIRRLLWAIRGLLWAARY